MERDVLSRESGGGGRRGSNNTLMVWSSEFPGKCGKAFLPTWPRPRSRSLAHGREEERNETLTSLALTSHLDPPHTRY